MKPEIGTAVYCIYDDGIFVDEVAFIGYESFIVESFHGRTYRDSLEWYYDDYEEKWFTDIEKAKEKLLYIAKEEYEYDGKYVVDKMYSGWYELVRIDE